MTQTLNCDQVSWIYASLRRFEKNILAHHGEPTCSLHRHTGLLACMLEVMEVCGLRFADEVAQDNALVHVKTLRATSPIRTGGTDSEAV